LVKEFGNKDSLFDIAQWLFENGYSEENLLIPDVRYLSVYLDIRNLEFYNKKFTDDK